MEVKVGDVRHLAGYQVTVIDINDNGDIAVRDNNDRFGICREQDFDGSEDIADQMSDKLSDLEIVQRALDKELLSLSIESNGDWSLYKGSQEVNGGHDLDFLLTWAKQTIGVE